MEKDMNKKRIEKFMLPMLIIILAALIRILPHIPNVTPIAAMAIFGGVYLEKKWAAFVIPLVAMLLSDIFIGLHPTIVFVYGSFAITILMGTFLKKRLNLVFLIGTILASSVLFFLVTNFGVWIMYDFYPKTFGGLMASYAEGIPFFRNTLLGDMIYSGIFFGSFEFIKRYVFQKRLSD